MQGLVAVQLLLTFLLLGSCMISTSLGEARLKNVDLLRSYFRCAPCDRSRCADTSHCVEVVKEPGFCGCCLTCAQMEGDMCGPYLNRCAPGLKCVLPRSAAKSGLQILMQGQGRCEREREPFYEDDNFIAGL